MSKNKIKDLFNRRKIRIRYFLRKRSKSKPRLSIFRSNKHIYAQIINDQEGQTLVSASTLDKSIKDSIKGNACNINNASKVGFEIAKRAIDNNIKEVYFDRGGYKFHGKIKSLAEAAREAGLKF